MSTVSKPSGTVPPDLGRLFVEAARYNWTEIRKDRTFCALVVLSASTIGTLTLRDLSRLMASRAARRQAAAAVAPSVETARPGDAKRKKRPAVNAEFWHRFGHLLRLAIPGPLSKEAGLLVAQMLFLVMRTLLTVSATKTNVEFLTRAIARASWQHWTRWFVHFLGWMGIAMVVNSSLHYLESSIAIALRRQLTLRAHELYLQNNNFYKACVLREGGLDNLDQRIAADIEAFATHTAHLYGHSFKPILEFLLTLQEAMRDLGRARPLMAFAWSAVISTVVRWLSPPVGAMIAKEQAMEGEFRRAHSRVIAHAEEVAFLQGSQTERALLNARFEENVETRSWYALPRFVKSIGDQFLKFQGLLVGGVFVHVPFLLQPHMGEAERIARFRATESLLLKSGEAFVDILLLHKSLQETAGYAHRIGQLFESLERGARSSSESRKHIRRSEGDDILFDGVTVSAPEPEGESGNGPRLLVKDLNLKVTPGRHVLVTGPNGAGKTSLFRALAGLWPVLEGTIHVPACELMMLPQKPYLVSGRLRDQVAYPKMLGADTKEDEAVLQCLEQAGLGGLVQPSSGGLGLLHNEWNDVLSGGERQRVGFARLYYHRPKYAIVDEATSAINPDQEGLLYEHTLAMGTTVFSIAHRMELRKYHKVELILVADGTGAHVVKDL